jgi:hypothetical protein
MPPAEHRYQLLDGEVYLLTAIAKAAAISSRIGSPQRLSQFHDEIFAADVARQKVSHNGDGASGLESSNRGQEHSATRHEIAILA